MQIHDQALRLVSPEVDAYCALHSTPLSQVAQELEAYTRAEVPRSVMLVGDLVGTYLRFMVRTTQAKRILEVGCYTGFSALSMAEGLSDDGKLTTLDIDSKNAKVAREYWNQSPDGKKIELILGDAKTTIPTLTGPFDLVFIDADKPSYQTYVELILPKLAPKGLIICDNCLYEGQVLESCPTDENARALQAFNKWVHSHPDLDSVLLPVRDGLMLIKWRDRH